MNFKVHIKVEQIARLRVAGISDTRICQLIGVSQSGLSRILALPEYKDCENSVLTGTVTKMDEALAGKADEIRKMYAPAVPAAAKALLDTVLQKRDLRARLEAAKEILDRDPDRTLAKGVVRQQDFSNAPALPQALLDSAAAEGDKVASQLASKAGPVAVSKAGEA